MTSRVTPLPIRPMPGDDLRGALEDAVKARDAATSCDELVPIPPSDLR